MSNYSPEYPGWQQVRQELELSEATYLASQGNIVLQVDGRGSRGRGEDWRRRLGEEGLGLADVEDQTKSVRLAGQQSQLLILTTSGMFWRNSPSSVRRGWGWWDLSTEAGWLP